MKSPAVAHAPETEASPRMLDSLTGLPSRSLFLDRLDRAVLAAPRGGGAFAVMLVEFAPADALDEALDAAEDARLCRHLARTLAEQVRQSDTVSRLSGATYGVLLPCTNSESGLSVLADKILGSMQSLTTASPGRPTLDVSIGLAVYPDHGTDARTLLQCADSAVAQAQRDGGGVQIGRPLRSRSSDAMTVTACDLRHAVANEELVLHYHPKIDLATRDVVGVEALVRWQRPGLGRQLPGSFIPAAERLACIAAVTDAIVDLALDQAKGWFSQGLHLPVSINVSARSFDDHAFVERILRALTRRGLPASVLTLEVTESALAMHPRRAQQALQELMAAGIGVAIDNFGAGHSSLRVLRDLGISEIKIDRQFVVGLTSASRDESIVRSISALGSGLDARVVAEGIEDRKTWDALLALGCRLGQGFEIAHPMAAGDFDAWLARWRRMARETLQTAPEAYYS